MNELKVFTDYKELEKYVGADGVYSRYLDEEINNHLACIGSNVGSVEIEIDGREYNISIFSEETTEGNFEYRYEVFEIYNN